MGWDSRTDLNATARENEVNEGISREADNINILAFCIVSVSMISHDINIH